jgi:hypothetical protein
LTTHKLSSKKEGKIVARYDFQWVADQSQKLLSLDPDLKPVKIGTDTYQNNLCPFCKELIGRRSFVDIHVLLRHKMIFLQ